MVVSFFHRHNKVNLKTFPQFEIHAELVTGMYADIDKSM
jgi:hypothetical protein